MHAALIIHVTLRLNRSRIGMKSTACMLNLAAIPCPSFKTVDSVKSVYYWKYHIHIQSGAHAHLFLVQKVNRQQQLPHHVFSLWQHEPPAALPQLLHQRVQRDGNKLEHQVQPPALALIHLSAWGCMM